jgi:hypothetical protein
MSRNRYFTDQEARLASLYARLTNSWYDPPLPPGFRKGQELVRISADDFEVEIATSAEELARYEQQGFTHVGTAKQARDVVRQQLADWLQKRQMWIWERHLFQWRSRRRS